MWTASSWLMKGRLGWLPLKDACFPSQSKKRSWNRS
jgi:hypothetical protein